MRTSVKFVAPPLRDVSDIFRPPFDRKTKSSQNILWGAKISPPLWEASKIWPPFLVAISWFVRFHPPHEDASKQFRPQPPWPPFTMCLKLFAHPLAKN